MANDRIPALAVAKLSSSLSQEEVEDAWDEERNLMPSSKPYLDFEVKGNEVRITVSPRHTLSISTDEIKRPFQIAIHRKHRNVQIEWLDGPMPSLPVR
jgi:hypothetical protein